MKKIFKLFLFILVFLSFIYFTILFYIKKHIPDLSPKVINYSKISFNNKGIPLIESESFVHGFSALGYPHTLHRRMQMEFLKRYAQGRLSEVFGEKYLEIDKVMRILNLNKSAIENYKNYPSELLENYSKIINETTRKMKKPFLSKFLKLRFEEWQPSDTYLILNLLRFDLNRNLKQELFFLKTAEKISPEILSNLFYSSKGKRCIKEGEIPYLSDIPQVDLIADFDLIHRSQHFNASNCFAIGKTLSQTSNPFLCNDPHLNKSTPPIWYLVKIKINGKQICGATVPGIPAVLIGHTDKLCWGFTSSLADVIDLKIVENINISELDLRKESIKIKNKSEFLLEIYEKGQDVLISKLNKERKGIFLKFFKDIFSSPIEAFERIYKSNNLYDAFEGFKEIPIPLNCIIADLNGDLGHIISGRIPKRKNHYGFFPSKDIEWIGNLSCSDIYFKEDKKFIISANEEKSDLISRSWCAPYRYERIMDLIEKKKWSFDDLKKLQRDVYSKQAEEILNKILPFFPEGNLKKRFEKWDFFLNSNSEVAYLYEIFYYKLFENLIKDELKEFYIDFLKITPFSYAFLDEAIFQGNENKFWDDIRTGKKENMGEIVQRTANEIENIVPKKWGEVHKLNLGYPYFKIGSFMLSGDLNTINLAGFMPEYDFKVTNIPALRFIVELKKEPDCFFEIAGGQSEHLFDRNLKDFLMEFFKN